MSEFLKPQSPLQHKDGAFLYPLTTADQVILEDNTRLNAALEDIKDKVDNIDFSALDLGDVVYAGDEYTESTTVPINADTLGGKTEAMLSVASAINATNAINANNATKLGGLLPEHYAHTIVNLLDNSNFAKPLNSRGQTSYLNGVEMPTIDRWLIYNISGASVYVEDGYIRLTKGDASSSNGWSLMQLFPAGTFTKSSYTLAYCDINGNITVNNNPIRFYSYLNSQFISIDGTEETKLVWAALYEGEYTLDTLPSYQPKSYVEEVVSCNLNETGSVAGGASSTELLWENASPNSSFVGQTISLDWTKYSKLELLSAFQTGVTIGGDAGALMRSVDFIDCSLGTIMIAREPKTGSTNAYRKYTLLDDGIKIENGASESSSGGITADNSYMVPIKIYGMK